MPPISLKTSWISRDGLMHVMAISTQLLKSEMDDAAQVLLLHRNMCSLESRSFSNFISHITTTKSGKDLDNAATAVFGRGIKVYVSGRNNKMTK